MIVKNHHYLDAAEYTIADAFLYHGGLEDKEYPIDINGDICKIELDNQGNCPKTGNVSNTLKVEVNGDKPTGGSITINGGNISSVEIVLDEKTIVKNSKGELVYLKYLDEVCTLVSGTAKTAGAKYTCKVDPNKEAYTFYVLTTPSAKDESINLIMDRNICSDGTVTEEGKTCTVAWTSREYLEEHASQEDIDNYENLNIYGPVTAMNYLYNATKDWSNVPNLNIEYDDEGGHFEKFAINGKARLPYLKEVSIFNGNNGYLYDNLDCQDYTLDGGPYYCVDGVDHISEIVGYWTLSSQNNSPNAVYVRYNGDVADHGVDIDGSYGVRAVINLKL